MKHKIKINWPAIGAAVAGWIVSEGLTAVLPVKYKPLGHALALVVAAQCPQAVTKHAAPAADDQPAAQ